MPGQVPKHISARASARKATSRATLFEIPPDEVVVPELPRRFDAEGEPLLWRLETQDWWHDIWSSPMSSEYHKSDIHGLYRAAVLVDDFWRKPSIQTSAELRQVLKDYGMTPLDRRRLEWTIESAEAAKDRGAKRAAAQSGSNGAQQPDVGDDPRLSIA